MTSSVPSTSSVPYIIFFAHSFSTPSTVALTFHLLFLPLFLFPTLLLVLTFLRHIPYAYYDDLIFLKCAVVEKLNVKVESIQSIAIVVIGINYNVSTAVIFRNFKRHLTKIDCFSLTRWCIGDNVASFVICNGVSLLPFTH